MAGEQKARLAAMKGFTFDGSTGRRLKDLYDAVNATGCVRDEPFTTPHWNEGEDRPEVVNRYLDSEGKRINVVWNSGSDGTSRVTDVVFDAPPPEPRQQCSCGGGCGLFQTSDDGEEEKPELS